MGVANYSTVEPTSRLQSAPEFEIIKVLANKEFGPCNVTVLAWLPSRSVLKRIYTMHPDIFPIGAEHSLPDDHPLKREVIIGQKPLMSRNAEEVKAMFTAYEKSFQVGNTSVFNIPVVDNNGNTLGSFNLGTTAGRWNDATLQSMLRLASQEGVKAFVEWKARLGDTWEGTSTA
ncbi:hypothetical protein D1P53_001566 [Cryptococcus gattii VGV]|nr:hypothetical protein D1P53_001566 [Cryptococcus gattii VGV]